MALLAVSSFMTPLSLDMYTPAVPYMAGYFSTTPDMVNLTLSGFFVCFTLGMLAFGPVSDRFGRKPAFVASYVLYAVGSLVCALSPTVEVFVCARVLQGLGAGGASSVGMAVVKDAFVPERRGAVLGGDILRGGVRGSPGVPSVAAPGQDVGVPGSGIPPVQVAAGGHGQERLQPLGHLPPKGWSFLPVGTPPARAEGAAVRAAGQAARRLPQAPQHQADAQHQRQQPGRRPQLPGGLSRDPELHHAGGVLRPLQSLPDLTGHKLFQTLVRSRAVPFCIQFPTPP